MTERSYNLLSFQNHWMNKNIFILFQWTFARIHSDHYLHVLLASPKAMSAVSWSQGRTLTRERTWQVIWSSQDKTAEFWELHFHVLFFILCNFIHYCLQLFCRCKDQHLQSDCCVSLLQVIALLFLPAAFLLPRLFISFQVWKKFDLSTNFSQVVGSYKECLTSWGWVISVYRVLTFMVRVCFITSTPCRNKTVSMLDNRNSGMQRS